LNEALAHVDNDQSWYIAEMHRLRGDLLLAPGVDTHEAEAAYRRAIEMAQTQEARLFELRATTSLARLWHKQGRSVESRQALAQICGWFIEGLDTPDLKEARALLGVSLSEPSAE
jgi:predicted ATPase